MSNKAKKVIVTGVSGQDGSYMVDYLLENTDCLVYGMVRRSSNPNYRNLSESINSPRFQFVTGDLSDTTSIDNLVREIKPDYFINLGAQSFVGSSWVIPEQTVDVTGVGVLRCLEAIRKHAPQCRFYSAGSSEQWGDVIKTPQDETHPMRPRSPYGAAKCLAAHLVKVYRESYGLYAVHGLLLNHESERRGPEFVTRKITLGVARIAKAIKEGKSFDPIELGNLDAKRDWSHAEDFVDGIWRMLNQETFNRNFPIGACADINLSRKYFVGALQEYVLSSNETHTVREFVEKAFAAAKIDGEWYHQGKNETYRTYVSDSYIKDPEANSSLLVRINPDFYRLAEVELLIGDSTRAKKELGWTPKISFNELVKRMVHSDLREAGVIST